MPVFAAIVGYFSGDRFNGGLSVAARRPTNRIWREAVSMSSLWIWPVMASSGGAFKMNRVK
jgi:hypothetical protein